MYIAGEEGQGHGEGRKEARDDGKAEEKGKAGRIRRPTQSRGTEPTTKEKEGEPGSSRQAGARDKQSAEGTGGTKGAEGKREIEEWKEGIERIRRGEAPERGCWWGWRKTREEEGRRTWWYSETK